MTQYARIASVILILGGVFVGIFGTAFAMPLTISGSMEGNLKINPGDTVQAGYDFTMPGNNSLITVSVSGISVVVSAVCQDSTPSPIMIDLPNYTVTLSNSQWYPSGDQSSLLVKQGTFSVPATFCSGHGGGAFDPTGASFKADFTSTDTSHKLNVRFHYLDQTAGGW